MRNTIQAVSVSALVLMLASGCSSVTGTPERDMVNSKATPNVTVTIDNSPEQIKPEETAEIDINGVTAFEGVLNALQPGGGLDWSLYSLENGVEFCWNGSGDAGLLIHTKPFEEAGMDVSKLEKAGNDVWYIGYTGSQQGPTTALDDFQIIADKYSENIKYDAALDRYCFDLGDGNMFEWARDITVNDISIVFVLNPEPFIAAGVDPNNVEGWEYEQIEVDSDGKTENVWRFLKAVDLR